MFLLSSSARASTCQEQNSGQGGGQGPGRGKRKLGPIIPSSKTPTCTPPKFVDNSFLVYFFRALVLLAFVL